MQEKLHNSISHAATFQESTTFHIFIYLKTPGMDYGCSLFYLSYLRQMWDFNGSECSDMKIWCHLSYHWVFFWESHFPTTNFWGLQSDKGSVHSGNSCMYFQLLLLCRKGFVCLCLLTWQKLNFQDSRGGCLQTCIKDRDGKWPLCYDMGWFDESLFGVCVCGCDELTGQYPVHMAIISQPMEAIPPFPPLIETFCSPLWQHQSLNEFCTISS